MIYLWNKFKGVYRVLPQVDLYTKLIPKLPDSDLTDPSYEDYYIPCRGNGIIKHATGNELSYYVESITKTKHILHKIYCYELNTVPTQQEMDNLLKILIDKQIITSGEILDSEGYFTFKTKKLAEWEHILQPSTKGSNIHPHSEKNITKSKFQIDADNMHNYKQLVNANKYEFQSVEWLSYMRTISYFTQQFLKTYIPDYKTLKRQLGIVDNKVLIFHEHYWNTFITQLEEFIAQYEQSNTQSD